MKKKLSSERVPLSTPPKVRGKSSLTILLFLYLFLGSPYFMYGESVQAKQTASVSGTVSDESGEELIGVSIIVKGTSIGTVTDFEGKYKLSNIPTGEQTLEFSYVGYQKKSVKLTGLKEGESRIMEITMTAGVELEEVVVTALGIKREEKALGYAVSSLGTDDVTGAMSRNWTETLSGKVAGLNMVKSGGGPIGSNKIILRGENSLSGNSEALIVVDGVIINSSSGRMTATGSSSYNTSGGETTVDFGSSLSDINPEDIENISVLKGPGAAALYGSRGANGAIIITTKSGKKQKGLGISVNSNVDIETINRWPDYQYEYGAGVAGQDTWYSYGVTEDGVSTRSTSSAWGPKFNGQMYYQYDPLTQTGGTVRTPWVPYKNNRKDFFETGVTYTNSVSVESGSDNMSVRLGYTNKHNSWIIPNTGYDRNTVALSLNYKVTPKLKLASKVNFTNRSSDNLPNVGYGRSSIMYFVRGIVPNANLDWMKDYWIRGKEHEEINRPFSSLIDNPYAIAYEMLNSSNKNQVTGNVSATYEFTKDLSLTVKTSLDFSTDLREQKRPKDTQSYRHGMFKTQDIFAQEHVTDFLIQYKKDINKLKINTSFGGSTLRNRYRRVQVFSEQLLTPNVYTFANSRVTPVSSTLEKEFIINSFYGLLALNYEFAYLDITGRNDWSSTLATPNSTSNCSFFYPSVNLSAVLTEAFELPKEISFLKVRASWSMVGSGGTEPYLTTDTYPVATGFPAGLQNPSNVANPSLKPLMTRSYEVGLTLNMFGNRFGIDVSAYKNNTSDQIIFANQDRSIGFSSAILNAGEVENKGLEIEANGKIIKQDRNGWEWSVFGTYSANRNKLIELTKELDSYVMYNSNSGSLKAYPGGSLSSLYGLGYKRAPEGAYIKNADGSTSDISGKVMYDEQGYALTSDTTMYIGDVTPKWKGSIGTNVRYKNVALSILFDGQFGGVGYSLTHAVLAEEGKLKKTLPGRYSGITGDGVIQNADGTYRINDVVATDLQAYYKSHFDRSMTESNTFKTDYIKLREVRLDYTIPSKILQKINIQKCVIGVYGRDLLVISNWPGFDPEFGELNGSTITGGFEIAQFPSTRTIGFNLSLGF